MLNFKVKKHIFSLLFLFCALSYSAQQEFYYQDNRTPEYQEVISYFDKQADQSEYAQLKSYNTTDAAQPLHLFIIDKEKQFSPSTQRPMILIMNAIHAGEPCGVDASMNLVKQLLSRDLPENVVIGIIPIYNIGGALNRNSHSRANQNGPAEYGFRGNAKNLDLNRDFIKADSKNAETFTQIFHEWKPHIFVDTHTSNGADYQYVFTLITSQKEKLNPVLKPFLSEQIEPFLYEEMKKSGFECSPYVSSMHKTPDKGIKAFLDRPRYSTGYAALFNTIGFTTEAHMFKAYSDRVEATLSFLKQVIRFSEENASDLIRYKQMANRMSVNTRNFQLDWVLDTNQFYPIEFKGYKAKYKKSKVTGAERLYYDRDAPFTDSIPFYPSYRSTQMVKRPRYYLIPSAWDEAIDRLKLNKVRMQQLTKDSLIKVKAYYIKDIKIGSRLYEGHYPHSDIEIEEKELSIQFHRGDYLIPMGQVSDYYTVTVLDPRGPDSFFVWNFFDEILQQKEWFSPYVFEESAKLLLDSDPDLKYEFERMKIEDEDFASSPNKQLYFLYKNSINFEKEYMRYPVYRID